LRALLQPEQTLFERRREVSGADFQRHGTVAQCAENLALA
jgi:hypothetical protein